MKEFFGLTQRGIITMRSLLHREEIRSFKYRNEINNYIDDILEHSVEPYWYGIPHFHESENSLKQIIELYDEKYGDSFNNTRLEKCKLKTHKSCAPGIIMSVIGSIYYLLDNPKYPVSYEQFNDEVFKQIKYTFIDNPNSRFSFDENSFAVVDKNGTPNLKKTLFVYLICAFYCFSFYYDELKLEKRSKANTTRRRLGKYVPSKLSRGTSVTLKKSNKTSSKSKNASKTRSKSNTKTKTRSKTRSKSRSKGTRKNRKSPSPPKMPSNETRQRIKTSRRTPV